jgi:hypothetical protein
MAYPEGRLLAQRDGTVFVLAPDGWTHLGSPTLSGLTRLAREEAEDWCEQQGWDLELLNAVPSDRA